MDVDQEAEERESTNSPRWAVDLAMFALKVAVLLLMLNFGINWFIEFTLAPINIKLRGGTYFWKPIEEALYKVADMPDLPPEKREKITKALEKIGTRYRPYIQALTSETKRTTADGSH